MSSQVHAATTAPTRLMLLLGLCGMVLGLVQAAAIASDGGLLLDVLFPVVAVHYWLAGIVVGTRRPGNGTGGLLLAASLSIFISQLNVFGPPLLTAISLVAQTLCLAVVVHILLALPGGRLQTRTDGRLMAGFYALVVVGNAHTWLFPPGPEGRSTLLRVFDAPGLYDVWRIAGGIVYTALSFVVVAVLLRRRARLDPARRRTLGPLYVAGAISAAALPLIPNLGRRLLGFDLELSGFLQLLALAIPPLALMIALRRGGFAQVGGVDGLARALAPGTRTLPETEARLGAALGDPSVRVAVWTPDGGYRSATGVPVQPGTGAGRRVAEVRHDGERVGAIDYDEALGEDPQLVRAATDVLGLVLQRERLTAQLLESRGRVVEAADQERRRIAQDLHDGLQARLVLLAIEARGSDNGLQQGIDSAIDELRRLVQGVMPSALIERDLVAAVDDLVDRMPIPVEVASARELPPLTTSAESTLYFVVAEAFSNALKHADARRLRVTLHAVDGRVGVTVADDGRGGAVPGTGLGLRGLQDRVEAVGGTLALRSVPGEGTEVSAEVPCAS